MGELIANVPVENLVYRGPEPPFDYLDRMTADILAMPVKPPGWPVITVRRLGEDKYEIINKIQTFRACVQAGFTTVTVDAHDLFDHQVEIAQILSSWEYVPMTKEDIAAIERRTKMKWALFPGRWQPCHMGHEWLIREKLDKGIPCLILVRDIPPDDKNPYTTKETIKMLEAAFHGEAVKIIDLGVDIESINWGRGVGYETNEHVPPADIGYISGTEVRRRVRAGEDLDGLVNHEVEKVLRGIHS